MAARTAEICRKNDEKRRKKTSEKLVGSRRHRLPEIRPAVAGPGRYGGRNFRSDRERRPKPYGGAGNAGKWPEGGEYAGKTPENVPETPEQ